jgi:hypothetical protein
VDEPRDDRRERVGHDHARSDRGHGQRAGRRKGLSERATGTSGHAAFTSANLFAPTYTEHSADLGPYAGQTIQLRFLYSSDPATNYENFYVDDVSIVDAAGNSLAVGVTNPDDMETTGTWVSGGTLGFSWVTADTAG